MRQYFLVHPFALIFPTVQELQWVLPFDQFWTSWFYFFKLWTPQGANTPKYTSQRAEGREVGIVTPINLWKIPEWSKWSDRNHAWYDWLRITVIYHLSFIKALNGKLDMCSYALHIHSLSTITRYRYAGCIFLIVHCFFLLSYRSAGSKTCLIWVS